jgi:hypothetical protein
MRPYLAETGSAPDAKEMMMRTYGHATAWGTHIGVDRTSNGVGWYQQLRDWWMAHKAARQEARLASRNVCWDSKREVVTPLRAEAAPEMAAAHHALSVTIMLYGLSQ